MTKKKIGIVNCGVGNFRSIINALNIFSDVTLIISEDVSELKCCDHLLLPGVGSFKAASNCHNIENIKDLVQEFYSSGRPILGICLGLQILFSSSTEGGAQPGLALIEGGIKKFTEHEMYNSHTKLLVPHVGFNAVMPQLESDLFSGITSGEKFYFTHSYYAPLGLQETLATTYYGKCGFTSAIQKGTLYAVQFHPELSGKAGLHLLNNFINL